MRPDRRRSIVALAGAALLASGLLFAPLAMAQVPPIGSTTSTTAAATPTTSGPSGDDLAGGSNQAPAGATDAKGDGTAAPAGGIRVPSEAQAIIDSIQRSSASSSATLVEHLAELQALGLSQDEAFRVGLGRFPIAGVARYSHDWLFPRYGPGFRFHLGTDVFAAYGTPVRAPVDGVANTASNSLGGLSVKVVMPDGTYFYLAHLSGLAPGFVDGMAVRTGDVVGYVGDSGNARGGAPHLHIGIYPHGGDPVDPKPILDGFLAEAESRVPMLVDAYRASHPTVPGGERIPLSDEQRVLRPMLATELVHPLAAGGAGLSPALLYLTGVSPLVGPRALLDAAVQDLVDDIDWDARADAG